MKRPQKGAPADAKQHERDRHSLEDLLAFGDLAADLVGRGRPAYDADVQLQLAAEAIQHRFGEAVARLSDELIDAHQEIGFRAMKRARNLVAHNYDIVDPEIMWETLASAFPTDLARIRALLDRWKP